MAASLDGFIARKDGRVDWLETSDELAGGDTLDPGFVEAFLKTIAASVTRDHISNKQSPRSGRQNIALLQGAEILSDVTQGWRDLRSVTPGYYLEPLRGWLS